MEWFLLAVTAAVLYVAISIVSKELMEETDPTVYSAILISLGAVFYTPIFLYSFDIEQIFQAATVAEFIAISIVLNVLGWFGYNYAIKNDPVSTVMPLNRLQPVFVAVLGFFVLNETVNLEVALGVLLASIGGYIVLVKDPSHLLSPFDEILTDRGEQMAIISGAMFAAAAIVDRVITTTIDPLIHAFILLIGMSVIFHAYNMQKREDYKSRIGSLISEHSKKFAVAGFMQAIALASILTAFSLQEASRVVPVLQLQVPISVILAGAILHEKHLVIKLIGSSVLLLGVYLVV